MPPPNANGPLHVGHALFVTLQDIMIRFNRMRGKKTLWLPGADHAGFETQVVFEKKLEKEKRNRFEIPREKLYEEMMEFTLSNKSTMENQLRKLGASCDWSREKFTLDPQIVSEVQNAFVDLYDQGYIYRGNRPANWCTKHQTGFSDLEVKYEERIDPLYYIKYGPFTLATVRPETKFGDTALAVHPNDPRYQEFIGKEFEIDSIIKGAKVRVIADEMVDPSFGTGVVKITPAHDPNDFEAWQRHKNEIPGPIEIIDRYGRMQLLKHFPDSEEAKKYEGMKIAEARKAIVEDLSARGLIERIDENYKHNVNLCYKCGNIIEPRLMPQWFVKMKDFSKKAIEAARKGEIKFIPEHLEKTFFHWLENIKDWNISRQIVWGIRIPAWQCDQCGEFIVSKENPKKCPCGGEKFEQDPDVFDTWFSSGQWPLLTLGYRADGDHEKDFAEFYPTSVMETAADIIFFWVARMIMFGLWRTGKVPFQTVYFHGLVRDKDRQKMSKSKGNVIDPLGVCEIYGTDALRMALVVGSAPGTDPILSEDKIRGYRNFSTKIWNASRFVLMNHKPEFDSIAPKFSDEDKKDLAELEEIKNKIAFDIEAFRFHEASAAAYHYFWHTFADKIIEKEKIRLYSENIEDWATAFALCLGILKDSLKILHPFMPFITEEVWGKLPDKKNNSLLMIEGWD